MFRVCGLHIEYVRVFHLWNWVIQADQKDCVSGHAQYPAFE